MALASFKIILRVRKNSVAHMSTNTFMSETFVNNSFSFYQYAT